MLAHRFDIFGTLIVVESTGGGWEPFIAGADGKRRRAAFEIPSFVTVHGLCQYLAELFHESATPSNEDARRID